MNINRKQKITSLLNKLSKKNYKLIVKKIIELDITQLDEMTFFTTSLINNAMESNLYIKLYAKLLFDIKNDNLNAWMNDRCAQKFIECISTQCDEKDTIGFIIFIGILYNKNIINNTTINEYITCLTNNINENINISTYLNGLLITIKKKFSSECEKEFKEVIITLKKIKDSVNTHQRDALILELTLEKIDL